MGGMVGKSGKSFPSPNEENKRNFGPEKIQGQKARNLNFSPVRCHRNYRKPRGVRLKGIAAKREGGFAKG